MPEMPLVFGAGAEGAMRYNLRKLGELTYHLARAARTEDLFSHCLFNYDWMYAKVGTHRIVGDVPTNPASCQLCAAPLSSLLSDYEDSAKFCEAGERRQVRLVGDCVRLGGAILSNHPGDIDRYSVYSVECYF